MAEKKVGGNLGGFRYFDVGAMRLPWIGWGLQLHMSPPVTAQVLVSKGLSNASVRG